MDVQGTEAGSGMILNKWHVPQHIVFRTDASLQMGTGHVVRCLTLADALRERGASCTFICRPHEGHLLALITRRGHLVVALPELKDDDTSLLSSFSTPTYARWLGTDWQRDVLDTQEALGSDVVDWLVVDHYSLDRQWEQALRPCCKQLMVIDDLADRLHDCDFLLDQNLGRKVEDYQKFLPTSAISLIGSQFALLRPEFAQLRDQSLARRAQPKLKHLLISMGGVDKGNATGRVLKALQQANFLPQDLHITVVMGLHAPWLQQIRFQAMQMRQPTQVLVDVDNMATLMMNCDLAIGAAGSTSWERCCLGVPTIQLVLAENQIRVATALKNLGAVIAINEGENFCMDIQSTIQKIDSVQLKKLTKCAAALCDGHAAPFIANKLLNHLSYGGQ